MLPQFKFTVPGRYDEFTVPGRYDEFTVPGRYDEFTVPGRYDEFTVPGRYDEFTVPGAAYHDNPCEAQCILSEFHYSALPQDKPHRVPKFITE
jgi:hypothetical protein